MHTVPSLNRLWPAVQRRSRDDCTQLTWIRWSLLVWAEAERVGGPGPQAVLGARAGALVPGTTPPWS